MASLRTFQGIKQKTKRNTEFRWADRKTMRQELLDKAAHDAIGEKKHSTDKPHRKFLKLCFCQRRKMGNSPVRNVLVKKRFFILRHMQGEEKRVSLQCAFQSTYEPFKCCLQLLFEAGWSRSSGI